MLDSFWEARGVFNPEERARLVEAAADIRATAQSQLSSSEPLPGVPATWSPYDSAPEVVEVSRRLVQLQELLGGGSGSSRDVDVTWMVVREPGLLTADYGDLMRRLIDMKVLAAGSGVDVVAVVEKAPSLLLSTDWKRGLEEAQVSTSQEASSAPSPSTGTPAVTAQSPTAAGDGSAGSNGERRAGVQPAGTSQQQQQQGFAAAWEFGLPSDGAAGWETRYAQLAAYVESTGDAHVGFRDGDDLDLTRWARKQRTEAKRGDLAPERRERLQQLGFVFDEDEAEFQRGLRDCGGANDTTGLQQLGFDEDEDEFQRWFSALAAFEATSGHCNLNPLATGVDLYLMHWCAIQRIALRSKKLSAARERQLTDLGFDWTGADPLS
ncbi:hypothetical protein FOA52_002083 [Chlamydomonas sp. UWO 241]|nr:hypothetical protein FOA52_002083 [Chlamydomonas sp. UWO 241]